MADRKTANIDYLCVIRENDGKTTFETIDIPASTELLSKLEGMVENENATVLDMQAQMNVAFPEAERRSYNYVSPYAYSSSYIAMTFYPTKVTFEEYQQEMASTKESLVERFTKLNERLRQNPGLFQTKLAQYLKEMLDDHARSLKKSYFSTARRFIYASNYARTLSEVKAEGDVRMYSTDTLGWSDFTYKVTDDITIHLGTNFGYGSASYFRLNLRYKGIDILPYSYMVRYYRANRRDILRYTRLYDVAHDSWNTAFGFVRETANLAAESAPEFVSRWILNEVREMVHGLHGILEDPGFYIRDAVNHAGQKADCQFLSVRNMDEVEKRRYGVYPEEMTMAYQAEKITGALDFLSNLAALSEILPEVREAVSEIQDLAVAVIPKLDGMVTKITAKVAVLHETKATKEVILASVRKELEPHEKAVTELYESRGEERKWWMRSDFESLYAGQHKDYAAKKAEEKEISDEVYKLADEIRMRENFREGLMECRQRVKDAGLIEAEDVAA